MEPSIVHYMRQFLNSSDLTDALEEHLAAALTCTKSQTFVGCTPKFTEIFEYGPRELDGRPINDLVSEDFRPKHTDLVNDYATNPFVAQMGDRRVTGITKHGKSKSMTLWLLPTGKDRVLVIAFK